EVVKTMEPTFGGVNLEDIKSPECFEIEDRLKKELNIPVMHDDQHGTAIISAAALLNALELAKKKINKVKFVVSGAGAAATSCIKLYLSLGANPKNIFIFDKEGILHKDRDDLTPFLQTLDRKEKIDLKKDMKYAAVFIGLIVEYIWTPEILTTMC